MTSKRPPVVNMIKTVLGKYPITLKPFKKIIDALTGEIMTTIVAATNTMTVVNEVVILRDTSLINQRKPLVPHP